MQIFIPCKTTLHVSGVTAPIIRNIENCTLARSEHVRVCEISVWCTISVCTVKNTWWWTEELSEHVEIYSTNKLKKLVQLTYLHTLWIRVLLEKLTALQLVKKFLVFHGTRRFITALTSVRHLSLSWASPIQSIYPNPTSWRSILILSTHLRLGLPSGLLPSGFPTKNLYTHSPHPYAPHAQPISFFSILNHVIYRVSQEERT